MVRVLNFFCVALMGLTVLGLYHVSEQTRVAHVQLDRVQHRIADEHAALSVLQTQWEHVASPERIQQLAESNLGMSDTATMQLSSLELLPRRGDEIAPDAQVRSANAQIAAPPPARLIAVSARSGM